MKRHAEKEKKRLVLGLERLEDRQLYAGIPDAFEPDDSFSVASALNRAQVHSLHSQNDVDWVKIRLAEPGNVVLETSGPSGSTHLELFSAGNTTTSIASDYNGGEGQFSWIIQALPAGDYYVRTSAGFGEFASDYTLSLTFFAQADLAVTAATASATQVQPGETIAIDFTVSNLGIGAADPGHDNNPTWKDEITLSTDAVPSADDYFLDFQNHYNALPQPGSYSETRQILVPSNTVWAGRKMYVLINTDARRDVNDSDPANNTTAIPIDFAPIVDLQSAGPGSGRFVTPNTQIPFKIKAIDHGGPAIVDLAIDNDSDPTNGPLCWLTTSLAVTNASAPLTYTGNLAGVARRNEPYYIWARIHRSDPSTATYTEPRSIQVASVVAQSTDALNDTIGGSYYEVFGLDAARVDDSLYVAVRTNFSALDAERTEGDIRLQVGDAVYGLAVTTHNSVSGQIDAGTLYRGVSFRAGLDDPTVPAYIENFASSEAGRSEVRITQNDDQPWDRQIEARIDLSALEDYDSGESITASWSMYCGNDTDQVTIKPDAELVDIIASGLTFDSSAGLKYEYEIANDDLTSAASLDLFWANAAGEPLGSSIFSQVTQLTKGKYGPFVIPSANYQSAPTEAKKLLLVVDQSNAVAESNDNNNKAIAEYTPVENDLDDQFSEAIPVNEVSNNLGKISSSQDVDMYRLTVSAGDKIAFDIDDLYTVPRVGVESLNGRVRVFAPSGKEVIADSGSKSARDEGFSSGYVEYKFALAGTYFVGVSGNGNAAYNPVTGAGDAGGTQGDYRLITTRILHTTTPTINVNSPAFMPARTLRGTIKLPDPGTHATSIAVSLTKVGAGSIQAGIPTWILIHGRGDNSNSFVRLGTNLDRAFPGRGHQVLLLDWRGGAADNTFLGPLAGATWISLVGEWGKDVLLRTGVTANQVYVVGHSWGAYVAFELSRQYGRVHALVALDPAFDPPGIGYAYDTSQIVYRDVARISWAFYGGGLYGSNSLSITAHESFSLIYPDGKTSSELHWATVWVFDGLLRSSYNFQDRFDLTRLIQTKLVRDWRVDAYGAGYEAMIFVEKRANNPVPYGMRYFQKQSGLELFVNYKNPSWQTT